MVLEELYSMEICDFCNSKIKYASVLEELYSMEIQYYRNPSKLHMFRFRRTL